MLESPRAKYIIAARREIRDMKAAGYERLGEGGGAIWELERGRRTGHKIVDAKISYSGTFVWVKVEDPLAVKPGDPAAE